MVLHFNIPKEIKILLKVANQQRIKKELSREGIKESKNH